MSSWLSTVLLLSMSYLPPASLSTPVDFGIATRFSLFDDILILDQNYLAEEPSNANGLIDCTQHCRKNIECMSFAFNEISPECRIFTTCYVDTADVQSSLGWAYYIYGENGCPVSNQSFLHDRSNQLCFRVTSSVNMSEARTSCNDSGADVISMETEGEQLAVHKIWDVHDNNVPLRIRLTSSDGGYTWQWESGAELDSNLATWAPGQPSVPCTLCVIA